jgi:triosephosphate isomerase (TIM)
LKIFAANWKLNKSPIQTEGFFKEFLSALSDVGFDNKSQVVFFPPATSAEATSRALSESSVQWGLQNCHSEVSGAFTGENSASVLKEMGGRWILLGHSERRSLFAESNSSIATKYKLVQSLGLKPMLCIGETLAERQAGRFDAVIENQLNEGLKLADNSKPVFIAYEPVWAIGTGQVATPAQVSEAHQKIHKWLNAQQFNQAFVLYGGSVKADNCQELIKLDGVDGFLVGGASLEVKSFLPICTSLA